MYMILLATLKEAPSMRDEDLSLLSKNQGKFKLLSPIVARVYPLVNQMEKCSTLFFSERLIVPRFPLFFISVP